MSHSVVGQIQGLERGVAEDAVLQAGQIVTLQPQGLEQRIFEKMTNRNLLDLVPEIAM